MLLRILLLFFKLFLILWSALILVALSFISLIAIAVFKIQAIFLKNKPKKTLHKNTSIKYPTNIKKENHSNDAEEPSKTSIKVVKRSLSTKDGIYHDTKSKTKL